MICKVFEVRSPATMIAILAIKLSAHNDQERRLLCHSGFGINGYSFSRYFIVFPIDGGTGHASTDPYDHKSHELRVAHIYIQKHFDDMENGEVIDIDYIEGNTLAPKTSDLYFPL